MKNLYLLQDVLVAWWRTRWHHILSFRRFQDSGNAVLGGAASAFAFCRSLHRIAPRGRIRFRHPAEFKLEWSHAYCFIGDFIKISATFSGANRAIQAEV